MVKICGCGCCVRLCKGISIVVFDPLWIISLYYLYVEQLTLHMSVTYLLQHIRLFGPCLASIALNFQIWTMRVLRLINSL